MNTRACVCGVWWVKKEVELHSDVRMTTPGQKKAANFKGKAE